MEKKYLLITAPISNGGDYLIENAMEQLLKRHNINFDRIRAKDVLNHSMDEYNAIITGGGPKFDDRLYHEDNLGINEIVNNRKLPVHFLGAGIYGSCYLDEYIYGYHFSKEYMNFLKKITDNGGSLGCRDVISYEVLKNNNCENVFLTGCPVWYLNNEKISMTEKKKKIVISDPGLTKKADEQEIRARQAIDVIDYIINRFDSYEICFTFNNGIDTKYSFKCNNIIRKYLEEKKIDYYCLDNSHNGFKIYDDAEIHIGFRVHSHLYCLSRGIKSILLEEDVRGYGMNESLGLQHIPTYTASTEINQTYVPNAYLVKKIDMYVTQLESMGMLISEQVLERIHRYYERDLKKWTDYIIK